jgi:hypothetical protein
VGAQPKPAEQPRLPLALRALLPVAMSQEVLSDVPDGGLVPPCERCAKIAGYFKFSGMSGYTPDAVLLDDSFDRADLLHIASHLDGPSS